MQGQETTDNRALYVGIDVSKEQLDVSAGDAAMRFANGTAGIAALRRWLRGRGPVHAVVEATGRYHHDPRSSRGQAFGGRWTRPGLGSRW